MLSTLQSHERYSVACKKLGSRPMEAYKAALCNNVVTGSIAIMLFEQLKMGLDCLGFKLECAYLANQNDSSLPHFQL